KPEERRVLVMRPAEFPDHRGDLGASAAFAPRQRLKLAGELDVVPLEDRPDQLFLAHEVPVERPFRDIDRSRDVAHARLTNALGDEEPHGGLFDAIARVGESVAWHFVSKRLFTLHPVSHGSQMGYRITQRSPARLWPSAGATVGLLIARSMRWNLGRRYV